MKLIGKNILIEVIHEEVKTSSGLLLSTEDTSQFRYSKGKVIEPGTNVEVISKGDVIYYDKRQGYTMLIENDKFTVIQERDVVVVL
jgi:co-chaperonin GroES (HSP10)|tara:strand:- start:504 stop:761 length:258 start_codon:yes stop_codon:yes gene_type:complete